MTAAAPQAENTMYQQDYSPSPIVIMEDVKRASQRLRQELAKYNVSTFLCQSLDELQRIASTLTRAMFAVDIDMGPNRREEGLDAIKSLKELSQSRKHSFYITALTSHVEHRLEAAQSGVDAFIVKTSTETDALELVTRLSVHNIEVHKEMAHGPQSKLAAREYKELYRQLRAINTKKRIRGLVSAIDTVHRALNWPFLLANEQLILSTLDEQLQVAQAERRLDKKTRDLCLEGVLMLIENRAAKAPVSDWIKRARKHSPEFIFSWLEDEDLDDE